MKKLLSSPILLLAGALLALSSAGCSSSTAPATGAVELSTFALTDSAVVSVTVAVTGPGIAEAIVRPLSKVGDHWVLSLAGIPVGTDRTFTLSAYDVAGTEIYRGVATGVSITAGQTSAVVISGQQTNSPAPVANTAPVIDSLVASSVSVDAAGLVSLFVLAHDPDAEDALSYIWTAEGGTFAAATSSSTNWFAPPTAGTYRLTVQVQDQQHTSAKVYVDVTVTSTDVAGTVDISITMNLWPVVTEVTSTEGRIDVLGATALDVTASDSDGDALAYAWSSTCAGTFSAVDAKSPVFALGDALPPSGQCVFSVTVADGRGGTGTGTLTITASPAPALNLAPQVTTATSSSTAAAANQTVALAIEAVDPEGTDLTFAWSATVGTLGDPTTTSDSSEVDWTAPAGFAEAAEIQATVTDATGVQTIKTFTVDAEGDLTAPALSALSFSSTTADTTAGPATITVAFTAADDSSGIAGLTVRLKSPSGSHSLECSAAAPAGPPASLTLIGSCSISLKQYGEMGRWHVEEVQLVDVAGNQAALTQTDLDALGLSSTLLVESSTPDIQPPALTSFTFTPSEIDVSSGTAIVAVSATVTDDHAGFNRGTVVFEGPASTQTQSCDLLPVDGSCGSLAVTVSCNVQVPRYGESGQWRVRSVQLVDDAENTASLLRADLQTMGFSTILSVTSLTADTTPATLAAFSLSPSAMDTSEREATLTVSMSMSDQLSGAYQATLTLISPSHSETKKCTVFFPWDPASHTTLTGSCRIVFPQNSETGQWTVETLTSIDYVGNVAELHSTDLSAQGFRHAVTVGEK